MEPLRSHRSKTVVEAARLHRSRDRRDRGLTLVEGPHLLADVTAAGARVVEVFALDPAPGETGVDERALARLAGTRTPRGPVAVVAIPDDHIDPTRDLLVSVGVSDPGNLGTMIRTAAAYGWGFAYTEGSADPWSPKVVRAGAGGQFQTPVHRISSLAELERWVTVACVVYGGDPPQAITGAPVALLIGEEATGLPEQAVTAAARTLTIPTPGPTESLNAAVAAAIAMHELSRRIGEPESDV